MYLSFLVLFLSNSLLVSVSSNEVQKETQLSRLKQKIDKFRGQNYLQILFPVSIFLNNTNSATSWSTTKPYFNDKSTAEVFKYSKGQEGHEMDKWLYENMFYGIHNGIIVESGALDGLQYSNSFMYENALNWRSVHIEPDPDNFSLLRKNRKHSINMNAALCDNPRLLHFVFGWTPATRGFYEFMPQSIINNYHEPIAKGQIKMEELPTIPCLKFSDILTMLNIHKINIWILDIEGAEESALLGTDFSKLHVDVIVMECDNGDKAKDERKRNILMKNDFTCQQIRNDCACHHKSFKPSSIKAPKTN